MGLTYAEWVEVAQSDYPIVLENYNNIVYEAEVINRSEGGYEHVELTLGEVLDMCEGTFLEDKIRRTIMKCVYAYHNLEEEIKKIMDIYYCI